MKNKPAPNEHPFTLNIFGTGREKKEIGVVFMKKAEYFCHLFKSKQLANI